MIKNLLGSVFALLMTTNCLAGAPVPADQEQAVARLAQSLPAAGPSSAESPASRPASRPAISAVVDPRVELMSIIFRLAGNPEYNMPNSQSVYADAVEKHFNRYRNHPVVLGAQQLRAARGVSYDAVMSMAVHVSDAVELKERVPFDQPRDVIKLDARWETEEARDFLKQARLFVRHARFAAFVERHRDFYASAAARLDAALGNRDLRQWFDSYFGTTAEVQLRPVVGLLNGGGCYGPGFRPAAGPVEMYSIIGAYQFDREGLPEFDSNIALTAVHEFAHSYANPLVDKHLDKMLDAAQRIFSTCEDEMRRQAYGNASTLLRESMVRACTVRYVAGTMGKAAAATAARQEANHGFTWVRDLSRLLEEYEGHRDRYPTLEAFMPRVVDFFNRYAAGLKAQERPRVISIVPANGATDVDPDLTAIKITFSEPMVDKNWSVVGGGPDFPEITGDISYDKDRIVLTIPVKLKPSWTYRFWLNRGRFDSFRSTRGVPLSSVPVEFKTRAR